jgi:hypothetical protein
MPRKRKPKGRKSGKKRIKTKRAKIARLKTAGKPRMAPLKGSFMITAIIGFAISALWVLKASVAWGATFMIFFAIMFIASLVSMTYSPTKE